MSLPTQAPTPGGEPNQLTAGLTGEEAHESLSPEPADHEPHEPHEPGEPAEPGPDSAGHGDEPDDVELGEEQPERLPTLVIPDLRPYADPKAAVHVARRGIKASRRPARNAARELSGVLASGGRHLLGGTMTLLRLLAGWLSGTYGKKGSRLARLGWLTLAVLGVAHSIAARPGEGTLLLVWAWCIAAIATDRGALDALTKKAKGKQQRTPGKTPAKGVEKVADDAPAARPGRLDRWLPKRPSPTPQEEPAQAPAEPPLTALIRDLIGDQNGVHLQDLRPAMRDRIPGLAEATDQHLRQVLIDAGFDPTRTFRARGVAGRAGVHRDDLPPLPSPESGTGTGQIDSPPVKSAPDLRKSPGGERAKSDPKSARKWLRKPRRQRLDGWTEEDVARGYRLVPDPARGPSAWRLERPEDVT